APGTGTVDCGGITSRELLASIHEIANSGVNVVGFDLVEVAPNYDPSEQTVNTASKLLREMILGWVK
ncbi:MAG: arginase family protein, partial [Psychrobacillus psychrotolerans]